MAKNEGGAAVAEPKASGKAGGGAAGAANGNVPDVKSTTKVDPRRVKVDPKKNISRFLAEEQVDDAYIRELAFDFIDGGKGNTTPVKVVRLIDPTGRYDWECRAGYNRMAAAMLILKGVDCIDPKTGETVRIHEPEFKIGITLITGNEDDALIENLRENAFQKPLTAMDYAAQVRYLKEIKGMKTGEIARLIRKDPSYISQYEKLLALPTNIQMALAKGIISPSIRVLMKLTECPPGEERDAYYQRILDGERVSLDEVNHAILNNKFTVTDGEETDGEENDDETETDGGETGDGSGGGKGSKTGPTMQVTPRVMRKFFDGLTSPTELPSIAAYAKFMIDTKTGYLAGKATDKKHELALDRLAAGSARLLWDYLIAADMLKEVPSGKPDDAWKSLWKSVTNGARSND